MSSTSPNPKSATSRFDLTPEQSYFASSRKKYVGYVSGVGAGKTFAGIARTLLNMEQWNPGEMGAIIAPTRTMVIDVIISEMRELGIFDRRYTYNSAHSDEPGIHAPNGSRALILSADNTTTVERLKGLNLAWWWMDEEAEIDPRAREILMQRLRTGEYRNGYITTTPKGRNHTFDFFIDDVETTSYEYGSGYVHEAADRAAITGVPTYANPHTPEDYHDAMADLPEEVRAQEVEGRFVEFGGGLLTRDMLTFIHANEMGPEERDYQWIVTADLALESDPKKAQQDDTDYWAASILAHDPVRGEAFLLDIDRTRGMTKDQGVGWLRGIMEGVPTNQVGIEANQAQRWFVEDAKKAGLNAYGITENRPKEERLMYLSMPFANDSVRIVNHDDPAERAPGQEYDPRWDAFVQEWTAFPNGAHDDVLDAVEKGIKQLNLGGMAHFEADNAYGEN